MSPTWADVVYVRPDSIATIHDLLPKNSAGKTPPGVEEATASGEYVIRGRIVGWFPGDPNLSYSAIPEDRQAMPPLGWGGPVIRFLAGLGHSGSWGANGERRPGPTTSKPVVLTIGMTEIARIQHEWDHFQDFRWMLSNRDQLLADLLGIRRDQISWGRPKIDAYLRYELGLERESDLPWGTISEIVHGTATSGRPFQLREGWLIRWLNDGHPANPAEHRNEIQEALVKRRETFHPLMMRTDIKSTVHEMLEAAARDYRYRGIYHGGPPKRPNFYVACVAVVSHLCDMAEVEPANPRQERIRDAGLQARQVLMEVLEAAQVGRLSSIDLDNEAVVEWTLPESPAARERMLKHLRNAQRPEVKSLAGLLPQPIQPSTVAMVALKVIEGSRSWWRYLIQPATGYPADSERFIRALVALFREEDDKNAPRASDWARTTPDKTPWDPDLGPISIMRRQVMNTVGIGPNTSGILTGADKVRFLNHFVPLVIAMDENERLFACKVLAAAGPVDPETTPHLVEQLFAAALGVTDDQEPTAGSLTPGERAAREKRNLRRQRAARLREDAIAMLARLAILWGPGEEESASDMVLDRLDDLYCAHVEGWASDSIHQLIDVLRTLTTPVAPSTSPASDFEEQRRRNYQRDVSRMLETHRDHATRVQQQAVARGDKLKEDRARMVLNVILNIQKGNTPR